MYSYVIYTERVAWDAWVRIYCLPDKSNDCNKPGFVITLHHFENKILKGYHFGRIWKNHRFFQEISNTPPEDTPQGTPNPAKFTMNSFHKL